MLKFHNLSKLYSTYFIKAKIYNTKQAVSAIDNQTIYIYTSMFCFALSCMIYYFNTRTMGLYLILGLTLVISPCFPRK